MSNFDVLSKIANLLLLAFMVSASLLVAVTNFPSNHEIVVSVMIYTAMVILTVVVAAGTWLRPRDTLARSQAA